MMESRRTAAYQVALDIIGPIETGRIPPPAQTVRTGIRTAIETATRVRITPPILEAADDFLSLSVEPGELRRMIRTIFEAAGFEVVD